MMKPVIVILFLLQTLSCASQVNTGCINKSKPLYMLPFPAGQTYHVMQGNCGKHSHFAHQSFAYDFKMPIGSYVTAMRSGKVLAIKDRSKDGTNISDSVNYIVILHDDSTLSRYLHLTQHGSLVKSGQYVHAGDSIALSGNSGQSSEPHLHVDITSFCTKAPCQTIPFSFTNCKDKVPVQGRTYTALEKD